MTKIGGEPTAALASSKKRSWSTTLHGRTPLYFHNGGNTEMSISRRTHGEENDARHPSSKASTSIHRTTAAVPPHQNNNTTIDDSSMQSILQRYHSLALAHYTQTKRRRLEYEQRSAQTTQRLEQLTTLRKMATDTLHLTNEVLRSEECARAENERERRLAEEEMRRAGWEKGVAENYLARFGTNNVGGSSNHFAGTMMMMQEEEEEDDNVENVGNDNGRIGGIPSKFLDLSHFPRLQKSLHQKKQNDKMLFSPEKDLFGKKQTSSNGGRPIIDCTEEGGNITVPSPMAYHQASSPSHDFPMRIPSFGNTNTSIPQEVAAHSHSTATCKNNKQNTKRIYISNASLSHVNGTYVQEGKYNDAPLYVRVGPPRKFMGKWDCSVVLRREKKGRAAVVGASAAVASSDGGGKGRSRSSGGSTPKSSGAGKKKKKKCTNTETKEEYIWKIGLVPAHRITHPRIIGYFAAKEVGGYHHVSKGVPSNVMDRMDEDDDFGYDDDEDEETLCQFDPPVNGWRVFQESPTSTTNASDIMGSTKNLGRASSLKVSYE